MTFEREPIPLNMIEPDVLKSFCQICERDTSILHHEKNQTDHLAGLVNQEKISKLMKIIRRRIQFCY